MRQTKARLGFIGTMAGDHSGAYTSIGQTLAEYLRKSGFSVVIASTKINKFLRLFDIIATLYVHRKEIDILIIQVYSGLSFIIVDVASWLGKKFNLPMIFHVHGGNLPVFMRQHPQWTTRAFQRAALVVAPSGYLAHSLTRYDLNVTVIPNIIDLSQYNFVQRRQVAPKISWLRAFHAIYNPALAVRTLSELNKLAVSPKLVMIGPDKQDGSLRELLTLADEQKVSHQVQIVGSVPKYRVPHEISQSDIFINTTNVDNTPVSVIEAMACGLCIVSTNVGGIPYLLEDGKDALLVPPNDPQAMAAAVYRLLTEPALAEKLSMNARRKVEQFDWSVVLPQWEMLFAVTMNCQ